MLQNLREESKALIKNLALALVRRVPFKTFASERRVKLVCLHSAMLDGDL